MSATMSKINDALIEALDNWLAWADGRYQPDPRRTVSHSARIAELRKLLKQPPDSETEPRKTTPGDGHAFEPYSNPVTSEWCQHCAGTREEHASKEQP